MADIVKGLFALIAVVGIVFAALALAESLFGPIVSSALTMLSSLDAAIIVALITGTVSILTLVLGSVINSYLKLRLEREEFLRQRREMPYTRLISLFYDLQVQTRLNRPMNEEELLRAVTEFNKELTLWGSSKAIKRWSKWRTESANGKLDPKRVMLEMEAVMIQLRKDMGQKRGLDPGDILKLFINDVDAQVLA